MSGPKDNKGVPAKRGFGPPCQVAIFGRDCMTNDLLAHALKRDGTCQVRTIGADDLMTMLGKVRPDLLIIASDVSVKSRNGYDVADAVRRAHPSTAVVLLINESTREAVVSAFRAGARGVFSREQSVTELLECINQVRRGLIWAGPRESGILLEALRGMPAPSPTMALNSPALTGREMQVIQHAAMGETNKVIAGQLGLSEHTVKNYLFRAFEKLGVSNRVELLFYLTLRGHIFTAAGVQPPASVLERPAAVTEMEHRPVKQAVAKSA